MRSRRAQRGINLLEVLITLAIVTILAMIAMPSMRDLLLTNRMKTLSLDLYTSLALARSEAIKRSSGNISMIASAGGWQGGWTVCVDSNASGSCGSSEFVLIAGDPVDSSLTLAGPAGNIVTYSRDGRVATGSAAFTIKSGSVGSPMRCVDVDPSGRPRTRVDTDHDETNGCN